MNDLQLEVKGVYKTFDPGLFEKKREVLKGVDFAVERGEIFGFLGPNGAGKTTTIKAITGLVRPDQGAIRICGFPHTSREARRRLGFMPESPYFYKHLTGREFLRFYGNLLELDRKLLEARVGEVLALVVMTAHGDRPMGAYSKGMLQRMALGQALLGAPELLILDEPMSGLDPLGRRLVRDLILAERERGATVFFSSHILPDVEALCDRVAILSGGRVAVAGAVRDIVAHNAPSYEIVFTGLDPAAIAVPLEQVTRAGDVVRAQVAVADRDRFVGELAAAGGALLSLTPLRPSLEDVMVTLQDGRVT